MNSSRPSTIAAKGMMAFDSGAKSGNSTKPDKCRGPGPQDHDRSAWSVAKPHKPMVHMVVVRGVDAGALGHAADVGKGHVGDRDSEDEQRKEQGRVEEVRLAAHSLGSPTDLHRGRGHQQPEEQRPGVTHEHPGGIEVVWQEADADPAGDHSDERPEVGGLQHAELDEPQPVDGERTRGDGDDAGREPVQPVDEVDRVRDADHP